MTRPWVRQLMEEVEDQLAQGPRSELYGVWNSWPKVHLAIFVEPFLTYVLEGQKTVESRFSMNKTPPYGKVNDGDLVLLKRSGGAVVGMCQVVQCWTYCLTEGTYREIRRRFAEAMCAVDAEFWQERRTARYATLMAIDAITRLRPIEIAKKDPRPWVVLNEPSVLPMRLQ